MGDQWSEHLRCEHCRNTGVVSLSQFKEASVPTVGGISGAFRVVQTDHGGVACMSGSRQTFRRESGCIEANFPGWGYWGVNHKGIEYTVVATATLDIWKWQFRIGDEIKTGRTETRLRLLAMRRAQMRIDRALKEAAQSSP